MLEREQALVRSFFCAWHSLQLLRHLGTERTNAAALYLKLLQLAQG
jgi:hypothetical protein